MTIVEQLIRQGSESLLQVAGEAHTGPAPIWLLVDPALRQPFESRLSVEGMSRAAFPIRETARESHPYLLALDLHKHALFLQDTISIAAREAFGEFDDEAYGRPRSVCAWLIPRKANADFVRTAASLSRWALTRPMPSSLPVLFRFWDPRIALELPARIEPAQCQAMLRACGLSQWWAINSQGKFMRMTTLPSDAAALDEASGWNWTATHWEKVNLLGLRNRLMVTASKWELQSPPSDDHLEAIASTALALGLESLSDLTSFSHCALTLHPCFHEHPEVAGLMASLQRDNAVSGTFSMVVQQWPQALREEIRAGLWELRNHPAAAKAKGLHT